MKVLLFGNKDSVFIYKFFSYMQNFFDVYIFSPDSNEKKFTYPNSKLLTYNTSKLDSQPRLIRIKTYANLVTDVITKLRPDIIHYHFIISRYAFSLKAAKKTNAKIIATIWGSDMYRLNMSFRKAEAMMHKFFQMKLFSASDIITVAHQKMLKDFLKVYGKKYRRKIRLARFGMPTELELIDRANPEHFSKKFAIPTNKLIITIGGSADPLKNQHYVLKEITKLPRSFLNRVFLIVPLTYGNSTYVRKVLQDFKGKFDNILFLTQFLSFEDIAALRKLTNILIYLPTTDAFSATVLESLYAGSVVLTGEWLPYDLLDEIGVFYIKLKELAPGKLQEFLIDVITKFKEYHEKATDNREKIWRIASWEANIKNWLDIYKEVLHSKKIARSKP